MELEGWVLDSLPVNSPNLSWRDALNIVITKKFKSVSNEAGFSSVYTQAVNNRIIGVIPIPTGAVLFSQDGAFSEIGIQTDGVGYTTILKTIYLNFSLNHPIEGVYKYNYKNDLIIAWSDNVNRVGLLNLSSLPFAVDGAKELVTPSQIVKSFLFPDYTHANFPTIEEYNTGGSLPEGVLYVTVRYQISPFDYTSCVLPSNPILVKQTSLYPGFANDPNGLFITANGRTVAKTYRNDFVSQSFKINITDLDTRYDYFEVILISKTHNNTSAKIYQSYKMPNSGNQTLIINAFTGQDIPVTDVTVPRFTFDTCKTLTENLNRLVPANIKYKTQVDFQKYVNNITVHYDIEDYTIFPITDPKYSYASSKLCFEVKTYQPNEVYALYMHLILTDGTITEGYTIPGRVFTGNDKQVVTVVNGYDANQVAIDPDGSLAGTFKKFHIDDTSIPIVAGVSGEMGFWENADEVYPDTADFDVYDATGNIGSIRGQNVRHHRLPHIESIYAAAGVDYIKVISLNFSNIYIPPAIESLVSGYFFTYAKRKSGTTLVQGEGQVISGRDAYLTNSYIDDIPRSVDIMRFYDYNLLLNKPNLNAKYLRNNGRFEVHGDGVPVSLETLPTTPDRFQVFDNIKYYPIDDSVTRNYHIEECIGIEFNNTFEYPLVQVPNSPSFDPVTMPNGHASLCKAFTVQLMNHCYNLYNNFTEQDLIFTGKIFKTDGSNNYSVSKLYGGDVFFSTMNFRTAVMSGLDDTDNANNIKRWFDHHTGVFSPMNYNLLFEEANKYGLSFFQSLDTVYIVQDPSDPSGKSDVNFTPLKYNNAFSSINNLVGMFPYNTFTPFVDANPFMIYRSAVFQSESKGLNWREFAVNDAYEMPRFRGEIWKVANFNKTLIIHQKYSLYTASVKDKLQTGTADTYLGVGDIFDRPPDEQLTSDKGTAGTQSQFACFVCDYGYISIDLQEGKIHLYDGRELNEISSAGLRNKFRTLFPSITSNGDNPFVTGGATATFDDINKRLIVCVFNVIDGVNTGITVSYSFDKKFWVGRHSYIGNHFYYNRNGSFAVKNFGSRGVYKMNSTNKAVFFGTTYKSSIDIVLNPQDNKEAIQSIVWRSLVEDNNNLVKQKVTFDKITVYNNLQSTPLIDIVDNSSVWFQGNSRELDETWFFNQLKDCVVNRALLVQDNEGTVNYANINNAKSWFEKSFIISNFVIVKLEITNTTQYNYYLNEIATSSSAKTR